MLSTEKFLYVLLWIQLVTQLTMLVTYSSDLPVRDRLYYRLSILRRTSMYASSIDC